MKHEMKWKGETMKMNKEWEGKSMPNMHWEYDLKDLKDWKDLLNEEEGMGTVEIILIIVVLVGLVLIFKEQITDIVESIFSKITKQTNKF